MTPFSQLRSHNEVVWKLYRALLRNSLHIPSDCLDEKSKINLLRFIRTSFRKQKHINNALTCQGLLHKGINWNEFICKIYVQNESTLKKNQKYSTLMKEVNPKAWKAGQMNERVNNLDLNTLLGIEKKNSTIPEDEYMTKKGETRVASWTKQYIQRHQKVNLIPRKSELDPVYIDKVLKSKVLYDRRKKVLERIAAKLRRPSTAGLKKVNGTFHDIYIINTPWNSKLFTERKNFIYDQRKKYDEYLLEIQAFTDYKERWLKLYLEEMIWEARLGNTKPDESWLDIFKCYKHYLDEKTKMIEEETINYNKRQYCYYQKLKPLFNGLNKAAKYNMHHLIKTINLKQVGPYTDVIGLNLGYLMKSHHFKDPSNVSNIKKW